MPGFRTRLSNAAWRPCPRRRQCHSFSFAYMGVSWFGLEWGWNETWGLWEHDLFQHFPKQVLTAFSFDICSTHCREYKRFIINVFYMRVFFLMFLTLCFVFAAGVEQKSSELADLLKCAQPAVTKHEHAERVERVADIWKPLGKQIRYAMLCIVLHILLYQIVSIQFIWFQFHLYKFFIFCLCTVIRVNTCARTCMWRHVFGQELWYFPWALLSGPGADRRILDLFDQHCGNVVACKRYIKISDILFGNAV